MRGNEAPKGKALPLRFPVLEIFVMSTLLTCMSMYHTCAWHTCRSEKSVEFPELELHRAVSHHVGAGSRTPVLPAGAASALNHWTSPPAICFPILMLAFGLCAMKILLFGRGRKDY